MITPIQNCQSAEPEAVTPASATATAVVGEPANDASADTSLAAKPTATPKPKRSIRKADFPDGFQFGGGPVPTTIQNVEFMMAKLGITARYNVIKKKLEIDIPGHLGTADNRDNATMTAIVSEASLNGLVKRPGFPGGGLV